MLAATNRIGALDAALIRPGRFDVVLYVPPPDLESRQQILRIHTANMPLAEDVDLGDLARQTEHFTGGCMGHGGAGQGVGAASGVVWQGMSGQSVAGHGLLQCGVMWCGVARCSRMEQCRMWSRMEQDVVWCGVVWQGMVWCG